MGFAAEGRGSTHERAGGLSKEVCAAGVADGERSEGVDDVTALLVLAVEGEAVARDGGLVAEEVVGEEGVRGVGVLGMGGAEAVLELADAVRELEDLFVEVLGGGEDEAGGAVGSEPGREKRAGGRLTGCPCRW